MSDLTTLLAEIDVAIAAVKPKFKAQPPATPAQLAQLRAAFGELPADVLEWFAWHNGSGDGFLPGTAWGLITVDEACSEIRGRIGSNLPEVFCPLVTGRDGCFFLYVPGARAQISVGRGRHVQRWGLRVEAASVHVTSAPPASRSRQRGARGSRRPTRRSASRPSSLPLPRSPCLCSWPTLRARACPSSSRRSAPCRSEW